MFTLYSPCFMLDLDNFLKQQIHTMQNVLLTRMSAIRLMNLLHTTIVEECIVAFTTIFTNATSLVADVIFFQNFPQDVDNDLISSDAPVSEIPHTDWSKGLELPSWVAAAESTDRYVVRAATLPSTTYIALNYMLVLCCCAVMLSPLASPFDAFLSLVRRRKLRIGFMSECDSVPPLFISRAI